MHLKQILAGATVGAVSILLLRLFNEPLTLLTATLFIIMPICVAVGTAMVFKSQRTRQQTPLTPRE